jgi:hypothetical protein
MSTSAERQDKNTSESRFAVVEILSVAALTCGVDEHVSLFDASTLFMCVRTPACMLECNVYVVFVR